MKISKITIKQLFGIKEWQGDGKNIELVGDNGTGKTSVIDAIRYALTNSSDREFIVKNGETEGEIYIETDNGLSIDRKARTAMTDYKSVKQNGNVIPSPESFLKTIFTPLQLSPMEFISMDKKTQNATILDMIQYDWNLDTIKEWFGEIPRDVNYEQNILAALVGENRVVIGRYSTKEKCRMAISMLMDCYTMNLLFERGQDENPRDLVCEYVADQPLGVFEMPQEDEIE